MRLEWEWVILKTFIIIVWIHKMTPISILKSHFNMPLKYQTQMMLHKRVFLLTTLSLISEYLTEAHIKSSLEKQRDVYFYEVTSSHSMEMRWRRLATAAGFEHTVCLWGFKGQFRAGGWSLWRWESENDKHTSADDRSKQMWNACDVGDILSESNTWPFSFQLVFGLSCFCSLV